MNYKNRIYSKDYYFINPIGGISGLDEKASGMTMSKKGGKSFEDLIFDEDKIKNAPHLFRLSEERYRYVVSTDLILALRDAGVDNLIGSLIEIT